jgi:hypothetical protein
MALPSGHHSQDGDEEAAGPFFSFEAPVEEITKNKDEAHRTYTCVYVM